MSETAPSPRPVVTTIDNWSDLIANLTEAAKNSKTVVLEFMAPWSEPSRMMEQPFREVAASDRYKGKPILFFAVNLDKFKNLGRRLRVEALPTFLLVKNMFVEDHIIAVNKEDLSTKMWNMVKDSIDGKSG